MQFIQSCQAANYPHKVLKIFDDSTLLAKHTLVRRSGISESASAGYRHLSSSRHNLTVSALRRVLQLANYIIRTATLAQRVTAFCALSGLEGKCTNSCVYECKYVLQSFLDVRVTKSTSSALCIVSHCLP